MKRIKFWHPVMAIAFGLSVSAAASYPAIHMLKADRAQHQTEIVALDTALRKALIEHNIQALDQLLADDFEIYTATKGVLSKQEWLQNVQENMINYTEMRILGTEHMQNGKMSVLSNVSGVFFGQEYENKKIETVIRSVARNKRPQIKCIVVKLV